MLVFSLDLDRFFIEIVLVFHWIGIGFQGIGIVLFSLVVHSSIDFFIVVFSMDLDRFFIGPGLVFHWIGIGFQGICMGCMCSHQLVFSCWSFQWIWIGSSSDLGWSFKRSGNLVLGLGLVFLQKGFLGTYWIGFLGFGIYCFRYFHLSKNCLL